MFLFGIVVAAAVVVWACWSRGGNGEEEEEEEEEQGEGEEGKKGGVRGKRDGFVDSLICPSFSLFFSVDPIRILFFLFIYLKLSLYVLD